MNIKITAEFDSVDSAERFRYGNDGFRAGGSCAVSCGKRIGCRGWNLFDH